MTQSAVQQTVIATAAQLLGRAVNICIPFIVLAYCGANSESDVFFLGLSISFFFYGTLCNALNDTLTSRLISDDKGILPRQVLVCSLIAAITTWTLLSVTSDSPQAPGLSLAFAFIATVGMATILWTPTLTRNSNFHTFGLSWGWRLLAIVAFFVLFDDTHYTVLSLAICICAGDCLRLLHLRLASTRSRQQATYKLSNTELLQMWPYLLGALLNGLNPIIDRFIAGFGAYGDISILDAADRIFWTLTSAATIGLHSVLLLVLGTRLKDGRLTRQYWHRQLRTIGAFSLVAGVGVYLASIIVVRWGDRWVLTELTHTQREAIANCLAIYAWVLPAYILSTVCARVLIVAHKHRDILISGILSVALNTVFSIGLYMVYGLPGVVAGTLISVVAIGIYCYFRAVADLPTE